MRRFWTYPWDQWKTHKDGDWPRWAKWVPSRGGDEYGRITIVLPIPFLAHLVIALYNPCNFKGHVWVADNPQYCDRCGIDMDLELGEV